MNLYHSDSVYKCNWSKTYQGARNHLTHLCRVELYISKFNYVLDIEKFSKFLLATQLSKPVSQPCTVAKSDKFWRATGQLNLAYKWWTQQKLPKFVFCTLTTALWWGEQSFILSDKFDCPVAHHNVSLLATAHDYELHQWLLLRKHTCDWIVGGDFGNLAFLVHYNIFKVPLFISKWRCTWSQCSAHLVV